MKRRPVALAAIKAVHTLAWFSIESCLVYLAYAGLRRQSDRRAAVAGAVVAADSLSFAANGFRGAHSQSWPARAVWPAAAA
jgi:hypothetical protein